MSAPVIALKDFAESAANDSTPIVSGCPICNAKPITSPLWTDFECGARVAASEHGSWALVVPCPPSAAELYRKE